MKKILFVFAAIAAFTSCSKKQKGGAERPFIGSTFKRITFDSWPGSVRDSSVFAFSFTDNSSVIFESYIYFKNDSVNSIVDEYYIEAYSDSVIYIKTIGAYKFCIDSIVGMVDKYAYYKI